MYSNFHFYIDFNWEDCVEKSFDTYLKELHQLVELSYQHKASVFYSKCHLDDFLKNMGCLDEGFSQSIGNKIDVILENAKPNDNKFFAFELCFAQKNTALFHVDNVLSTVDTHDKIAILTFSNKINSFLLVKSVSDFCKIKCENISNRDAIVNWISETELRTFNVIPKHGENGKGNQPKESILLCSKEEAQLLLNTAIPCFMEREKNLFNYDKTHNTYVMFYFEGNNPQKQWHGFHLEKKDWDSKVPHLVRKYFGT